MIKVFFETIQDFIWQGGPVLILIFIVTALMWALILEKILYFRFHFISDRNQKLHQWKNQKYKNRWIQKKIRELEISQISNLLSKNINHIKILIAICPLLGLLGTVTGMISVFEIMAEIGTGNARLMAGGISLATIPTMAGMICALSGICFISHLDYKFNKEKQKTEELFNLQESYL